MINLCISQHALRCLILMITLFSSVTMASEPQEQTVAPETININAWVVNSQGEPQQKYSINEFITLYIEVSTPRWFSGGTKIGRVEIDGAIVQQRKQFATNYTERKNGVTWSKQRWEIAIYPQISGSFNIPSVKVDAQISLEGHRKQPVTLYTKALTFEARLPSGLLSEEIDWFTATDAELNAQWHTSSEQLKVGDSLSRTVTLTANDSLSILLPTLLSDDLSDAYQVYASPTQLKDDQHRRYFLSTRAEKNTYVLQQGGDIHFPSQAVVWWNSKDNRLETLTLPAKSFTVKHTFTSLLRHYWSWIVSALLVLSVAISLVCVLRSYYRDRPLPALLNMLLSLYRGQWNQARTQIYQRLRMQTALLELSRFAHSTSWKKDSENLQANEQNVRLFMRLWLKLKPQKTANKTIIPKQLK